LNTNGQNSIEAKPSDSSLKVVVDTTKKDSLQIKANKKALKVKVEYNSDDSICFDFKIQKAFLYKNAEINYEKSISKQLMLKQVSKIILLLPKV